MRSVMASKWESRTPVEDRAQEQAVIISARAAARQHGLGEAGVAAVFDAEIATAKTVQLGWGRQWLLHGSANEPAPDIAQIHAKLATSAPGSSMPWRSSTACTVARARAALLRDSRRLIRTRFVTRRGRADLARC